MLRHLFITLSLTTGLGLAACNDGGGGAGGAGSDGAVCATNAECNDGLVCLAYGSGTGLCSIDCTVSADECSGEATCAGVGSIEVDVCQDPANAPDPEDPPEEEDRPRIPCDVDADCAEFGSNAICAEWKGVKDCTIACDAEDDCTPPTFGGIGIDFLTCLPDEADDSRDACVPDEACFTNPLNCVDLGGLPI